VKRSGFEQITEVELAAKVIAWLRDMGWEIYQEVQLHEHGGKRADIVAKRGRLLWVVECKLQFGVAVLEQARRWLHQANYVSVACGGSRSNEVLDHYCALTGIGRISVPSLKVDYESVYMVPRIQSEREPALRRAVEGRLLKALREEHKTWAPAGNADSLRWSPFQATCKALADAVKRAPGVSVKDAIAGLEHHYRCESTARACLLKWAETGSVPGVYVRRDGRKVSFWPAPCPGSEKVTEGAR
jgi:hypothetical protein